MNLEVKIDRKRRLIAFYFKGKRIFWMRLERWEQLKNEVDRKIAKSHRF